MFLIAATVNHQLSILIGGGAPCYKLQISFIREPRVLVVLSSLQGLLIHNNFFCISCHALWDMQSIFSTIMSHNFPKPASITVEYYTVSIFMIIDESSLYARENYAKVFFLTLIFSRIIVQPQCYPLQSLRKIPADKILPQLPSGPRLFS